VDSDEQEFWTQVEQSDEAVHRWLAQLQGRESIPYSFFYNVPWPLHPAIFQRLVAAGYYNEPDQMCFTRGRRVWIHLVEV